MSISTKQIHHANVEWRQGQPYATTFQDVYFSSDNGLAETEYVFLQGNDLLNRWQTLQTNTFIVIETGFGTGLNFLCASELWLKTAPPETVLYFYSVEKFPLTMHDIKQALQYWPQLSLISEAFLREYAKVLLNKNTISLFNGRVQLTLLIGDASEQLSQLSIKADACFLDGFAPSKNPDMWQSALFAQIAKLSTENTTFATFTSAGVVRRGLLATGFSVNKRAGFGKKREMLQGKFVGKVHG